jgi:hypothetical protein
MSPKGGKSQIKEAALLDQFVASFSKFDEMAVYRAIDPIAAELAVGEEDEHDRVPWQPLRIATDSSLLEPLYAQLPTGFPPLFERLVLSYRWAEVDLQLYTLLANPPGPNLSRLLEQMSKAPAFWESLRPAGYIQFAKGPDYDYDPVCFDIKRRRKNRDCPVVKIDHEEILCNNRIKVVEELASGFEELVLQTIAQVPRFSLPKPS